MADKDLLVTIPQWRYENLLDTETRVNVAVERLVNDEFIKTEVVLRILGTELALLRADELREEEEKRKEKYSKDLVE